jgi:2-hydroxychromene-2-carboxylate isomerase
MTDYGMSAPPPRPKLWGCRFGENRIKRHAGAAVLLKALFSGGRMARSIDYYFSLVSPWAYIGHVTFMDVMQSHGVTVKFKPMSLAAVFPETGGLPLAKRAPARQRYRILELQRWREKRGVRLNVHPKFWPFNVETADHLTVAIVQSGANPDQFLRKAFTAVWADEKNLGEEGTLAALADDVGLPGEKLLAVAKSGDIKKIYQQNIADALAIDAFGSPCYVFNGEAFWGQDRIELLDDALKSKRSAYRNDI